MLDTYDRATGRNADLTAAETSASSASNAGAVGRLARGRARAEAEAEMWEGKERLQRLRHKSEMRRLVRIRDRIKEKEDELL